MERHRIVGETVTGNQYTVALVRELSDDGARELAGTLRGKARSVIPTDIVEVVTIRERYAVSGMTIDRIEIGRIQA